MYKEYSYIFLRTRLAGGSGENLPSTPKSQRAAGVGLYLPNYINEE